MRRLRSKGAAAVLFLAVMGIGAWMTSMRSLRERRFSLEEGASSLERVESAGGLSGDSDDERPWSYEDDLGDGLEGELRETAREVLDGEGARRTLQALEAAMDEMGEVDAFEAAGELPGVAAHVLESYEDQGARLMEATYLDLMGNAWGCVILGDAWVDICVVRDEGGGLCLVEVVTLDAEDWEGAFA